MKKYKKTYAIRTLSEKHTTFHLGKTRVRVSFTGGQVTKNGVNPATFTTADPIVQLAIERSNDFAKGAITLLAKYPMQGEVKIGKNPPEAAPGDKPEAAPGDKPEAAEAETAGDLRPQAGYAADGEEPDEAAEAGKTDPRPQAGYAADGDGNPAEGSAEDEEAGVSNLEVVEVSCSDVAKQYLQEHFGEKPAPLRRIADIQECAAKYGITFNFV